MQYQLLAVDATGRQARLPRGRCEAFHTVAIDAALAAPIAGCDLELTTFPNPANPRVELRLQVAPAGWCQVEIVDVRGRLVARLPDGQMMRRKIALIR